MLAPSSGENWEKWWNALSALYKYHNFPCTGAPDHTAGALFIFLLFAPVRIVSEKLSIFIDSVWMLLSGQRV